MAAECTFLSGEDVLMIDHTPGAAVAAGEVVIVGSCAGIAHHAIPANVLGALGWQGGEYKSIGDGVIAKGVKVYWDNTANKVTATATANTFLGDCTFACTGNGAEIRFSHLQSAP